MSSATLTTKGQVTIPKDIRERLGVSDGDELDFIVERDGRVWVKPRRLPAQRLYGMLGAPRPAPSLAAMDRGVSDYLASKNRRSRRRPSTDR